MKSIFKLALFNSLSASIYIVLVGSFLYYAAQMKFGQGQTVFVPIFLLMLLVFSAALTGALIFGQPVLWYLEGKKKEALLLLTYTLGIFFVITIFTFFGMLAFTHS
jgi:hypothetical protein